MIKIIIPIEPKAQKRLRFSNRFGHVVAYEARDMREWKKSIVAYLKKHYRGDFLDVPLGVTLAFYMRAPKATAQEPTKRAGEKRKRVYNFYKAERLRHFKKPDIDNLVKAVLDCVTQSGVIWKDDSIISELLAVKYYSDNPRTEFIITILEEYREDERDNKKE